MVRRIIFILVFINSVTTVQAQFGLSGLLKTLNNEDIPYIEVTGLYERLGSESLILLDARETPEYSVSHIPGAFHVGYEDFDRDKVIGMIADHPGEIVVYCSLGVRSEDIGEKLRDAGVERVYNLYGGIFEWVNSGFPVEDDRKIRTDKVHAYNPFWGIWLENGIKIYD